MRSYSNRKGFFSFLLVFLLSVILLTTFLAKNTEQEHLLHATTELMQNELMHKEKTLLENNVDTIVKQTLNRQVLERNFNNEQATRAINTALYTYLADRAEEYHATTKNHAALTINFLNNNSTTFVYELEGVTYGVYTFTSDETLSSLVHKKLGDTLVQDFLIPAGYTQETIAYGGAIVLT